MQYNSNPSPFLRRTRHEFNQECQIETILKPVRLALLLTELNFLEDLMRQKQGREGTSRRKYLGHFHRTRVERHVYGAYFTEDGGMIEMVKCILHI